MQHCTVVIVYRILVVIDAVVAPLVTVYAAGVLGEYVSSEPSPSARALLDDVLWAVVLLAGAWLPLILGLVLKARGRLEAAKLILFVPVLPASFCVLFVLALSVWV